MATDIDYKNLQQNIGILMTNHVSLASKLYDLFVSETPMDVEIKVWTAEDVYESFWIPNRAKGSLPAKYGEGNPTKLEVEATYGVIYLDTSNFSIYIKTTQDGYDGWKKVLTSEDMVVHNIDPNAHDEVLAKVDGDEEHTFKVANAVDPKDAINGETLGVSLGGLDNLNTENKTVVGAINEVITFNAYDQAVVVNGAISNGNPDFMAITEDTLSREEIRLSAPFTICTNNGNKIIIDEDIVVKLTDISVGEYSVYYDINNNNIVILSGKFYKCVGRPPFITTNDVYLDISIAPSVTYKIDNNLDEEEVNYIYLGKLLKTNPLLGD